MMNSIEVIQLQSPGGPEVLELVRRPRPEPRRGEVRVKAAAIGVGSADTLIRSGRYMWMPPLPAVPGNEMAGVIDAVGDDVDAALLGTRVLVSSRELPQRGGCYAQAICVPASAVYALPESLAPHDAVTLPNYQLAGAFLYDSGIPKPSTILIHGAAGGVATALIQLCLADGIVPIGTVSTDAKLDFARRAGAPHVIHRGRENVRDAVLRITEGHGVDAVYDRAGPGFTSSLDLLAMSGTLISINSLDGAPDADLYTELKKRLGRSLGVRCYSIHTLDQQPARRRAFMQRAIDLMTEGRLRPPPPTLLPLADAARAHAMLEAGETLGKLVLVPGPE
jgi:NADPH2:quinone reductase